MILRRISLLVNGCEEPEYIAPIAKNLTYNGSSQELLTAGSTNDGTIYYSIDNSTWDVNVPSVTNAGSYTVYWKLVGDEGYCDIKSEINVTIAKADTTYTAPTAKSLTYNGSAQALLNAGAVTGGTIQYSDDNITWGTSIPTGTNANTYTSYWRIVGDGNHNDKVSASINTTIAKVTPTVVAPTAKVLTYNGSAQELVNVGSTDYGTLQYKVSSDSWSTNIPTRTRGGSYTVQYRVVGDSNVNDVAAQSVQCSINEKQVTATVTLSQTAYTYNGSACEPSATVSDGGVVIDPSEYTVTYSNNVNAGTGTVTISDNVGGDYEVIGSATFTINKANSSLSFAVTNVTVVVGGTRSNVVTVNSGDGTVTYNSNDTSVVTVDNNGSITGVSVGNATITANISSTSNYNSASTSYTSYCVEAITAKYNVTDTSNPTRILSSTTSISDVYIDGVKQPSVTTGYTFSTTGEHTVKYKLRAPTNIGNSAFTHCSGMTSIDIPDSVTSIGNSAFYSCDGLTSVNIPSGVTSIGDIAFGFCDGLTSIDIPDSVTSIGNSAFTRCHSLTSIEIPSGVTSISNSVFFWCTSLRSVNIPSGVTSIGASAFTECSFTSIEIPSGVTSIGDYTFFDCTSLTSVTCNATTPPIIGISSFNTYNNCPIYVPTCSLIDTYQAASVWSTYYSSRISSLDCQPIVGKINVTSTSSPTKILGQADRFISVSIDGVEQPSINTGYTFSTTGEHTVKYKIKTLSVGESAFNSCTNLTSITMPNSITSIGNYAFSTCSGLTSINISSSVTSIGDSVFYSAASLTSIVIPDSVISIGNSAFEYCRSLTSCTIGSGVTSIGTSAFNSCSGLTSIVIPDSVTSIGNTAFYRCTSLTSCTIGSSVTSIGSSTFNECTSLSSCTIGSGVTSIGTYSFGYCSSLTSIDIPDSVTSIGSYAFQYCRSLTSCTIGSGVTSIGQSAFSQCSGLTSIDIPDSVTSIGSYAFSGCKSFTGITIPDSVTSIGDGAFSSCGSLTSCTIGSGVTRISEGVFYNCSGFTSIVIPSGVTRIGNSAFENCSSLISITVEASTPPTLGGNYVFFNTNNCPIYVICDSVDTYKAATIWSTYASRIQAIPGSCPIVVVATFNVTDTSNPTMIASGTSSFTAIEIDGVEQPSVTTGYTFSTTGEHTVKYILNGTSIGDSAFYQCSGLTSCTIGSGVTSIGGDAFYRCSSLTSIDIPDSVTSIGNYAFSECSGLTGNLVIPNSVTSIGFAAFLYCTSLTSCTIGSGVTNIDYQAFYGCSGSTSIVSSAATAPTIQSSTFRYIKTGGTLTVPIGSSGYDVWMGTGNYYLGYYNWTKVEQ